MEIINISRLGNQIKSMNVIGINCRGSVILYGTGEEIDYFRSTMFANRVIFYEYNPVSDELKQDIFNGLRIIKLQPCDNRIKIGKDYFLEAEDSEKVNIVKLNFNDNTYERLYTIHSVGGFNIYDKKIQLISLSEDFFAFKLYNDKTCQIYIYDVQKRKKYSLLFSKNDDMRYADIKYLYINKTPYILVIKNGKSDWRMKTYIHKWEWIGDSKKLKDEKMFLFALQELANNGSICIDDEHMIAHADERYELKYHIINENCIIYSIEDFERYNIDYDNINKVNIISLKKDFGEYEEKKLYENNVFFYDVASRQITKSIPYYNGYILVSNKKSIYCQENNEQLVLKDLNGDNTYKLPYNSMVEDIIGDYLIIREIPDLIIYDLKNKIEIGRYFTEDQKLNIGTQIRAFNIYLDYKYFEKEDVLVLF